MTKSYIWHKLKNYSVLIEVARSLPIEQTTGENRLRILNLGEFKIMKNGTGTVRQQAEENLDNVINTAKESTDNFKERVAQKVGETKDKVTGNLSTAADKFHERSDSAQQFLDSRADSINEYAHQAIEKANQFGHRAADALSSSSDYINNFDYERAKNQVVSTVKDKPQIGMAVAGIFGLLIGLIIGGRRSSR